MKALAVLFTILVTIPVALSAREKPLEVSSPDKSTRVQFTLINDGIPFYTIQRNGQTLISNSKLGFVLKDQPALTKDFLMTERNPVRLAITTLEIFSTTKTAVSGLQPMAEG